MDDGSDRTEVDVFFWKGSSIAGCSSYLNVRVRLGFNPSPAVLASFNDLVKAAQALDVISEVDDTPTSV